MKYKKCFLKRYWQNFVKVKNNNVQFKRNFESIPTHPIHTLVQHFDLYPEPDILPSIVIRQLLVVVSTLN